MLRLIGLVVAVLLVLSLAHGERTGGAASRIDTRAQTLADDVTGALADGLQRLGDLVFGPAVSGSERPRDMRDLALNFDALARSTDAASRRTLAQLILRSCPSLGLVCRPAGDGAALGGPRHAALDTER